MRKLSIEEPFDRLVIREVTHDPVIVSAQPHSRSRVYMAFVLFALLGGCLILGLLGVAGMRATYFLLFPDTQVVYRVVEARDYGDPNIDEIFAPEAVIASFFTPEVQFWAPMIARWSAEWNINPNLIATLIQIESCGDPTVSSPSGAQGLFQVMPFHFNEGEDMVNVENNSRRGLAYLAQGLVLSDGHPGLALAGYNGGHGVIKSGYGSWYAETRRYYYWGSGIYEEAMSGQTQSQHLQEWLNAGGQRLCDRAAIALQTFDLQPFLQN